MNHPSKLVLPAIALAFAASCLAGAAAPTPAPATDAAPAPEAAPLPEGVTDITPEAVEKLVGDKTAHIYDVNSPETRNKFGVVPSAMILGSTEYSLKRLAKDKESTLVFYCANPRCTASHAAAQRALAAGYKDVRVMSAGIKGWVDAGHTVEKAKG